MDRQDTQDSGFLYPVHPAHPCHFPEFARIGADSRMCTNPGVKHEPTAQNRDHWGPGPQSSFSPRHQRGLGPRGRAHWRVALDVCWLPTPSLEQESGESLPTPSPTPPTTGSNDGGVGEPADDLYGDGGVGKTAQAVRRAMVRTGRPVPEHGRSTAGHPIRPGTRVAVHRHLRGLSAYSVRVCAGCAGYPGCGA